MPSLASPALGTSRAVAVTLCVVPILSRILT